MFPADHAFQFYKLAMIFQLLDILDSTRPWSLFLGTSGGLKCGRLSKSMCFPVISVHVLRTPTLALWTIAAVTYSQATMVFCFNGFHHQFTTIKYF